MQKTQTEVIIIGGGIVGLVMAGGLARAGIKVALIERDNLAEKLQDHYDGRAIAVSAGSQEVIGKYGLWGDFADQAGLIEQIRVSDGDYPLFLHFDNQLIGNKPLGYMLEFVNLMRGLYSCAKHDNLQIIDSTEYQAIDFTDQEVVVHGKNNLQISGQLLVAADGKYSKIREMAAIKTYFKEYDQSAIVCNVSHQLNHSNIAQERFLPAGPFAILPLKDGYNSSIVWTEKAHLAPVFYKMQDEEFLFFLKERFTDYLGEIKLSGKRFIYPLNVSYAKKYYSKRMALIGDAAHAIHPIAGQGLNMGIRDVDALISLIKHHKSLGLDLGSEILLQEYQSIRKPDNQAMITITDALNSLFSNNNTPISKVRRLGLGLINRSKAMQKYFMEYAMGLRS